MHISDDRAQSPSFSCQNLILNILAYPVAVSFPTLTYFLADHLLPPGGLHKESARARTADKKWKNKKSVVYYEVAVHFISVPDVDVHTNTGTTSTSTHYLQSYVYEFEEMNQPKKQIIVNEQTREQKQTLKKTKKTPMYPYKQPQSELESQTISHTEAEPESGAVQVDNDSTCTYHHTPTVPADEDVDFGNADADSEQISSQLRNGGDVNVDSNMANENEYVDSGDGHERGENEK